MLTAALHPIFDSATWLQCCRCCCDSSSRFRTCSFQIIPCLLRNHTEHHTIQLFLKYALWAIWWSLIVVLGFAFHPNSDPTQYILDPNPGAKFCRNAGPAHARFYSRQLLVDCSVPNAWTVFLQTSVRSTLIFLCMKMISKVIAHNRT